MQILITGMEMPVTCCHCPLMGYDPDIEWNDGGRETQGAYICVLTHELIDNTKREEHCPLVPVPPHGRLGDLEQAVIILERLRDHCGNGDMAYALNWAANNIRDLPTIIPAEEGET